MSLPRTGDFVSVKTRGLQLENADGSIPAAGSVLATDVAGRAVVTRDLELNTVTVRDSIQLLDGEVVGILTYEAGVGLQLNGGIVSGSGSVGPTGAPGAGGSLGPTGPTGDKGEKGERGLQGVTGPTGEKGEQGIAGPTGERGGQGVAGPTGERGGQGVTGPTGERGGQGVIGPTGERGGQGIAGPTGPVGTIGTILDLAVGRNLTVSGDSILVGNLDVCGASTFQNKATIQAASTTNPGEIECFNQYLGQNTSGSDITISQIKFGTSAYHDTIRAVIPPGFYGDICRLDLCTPAGSNNNTQTPRISIMPTSGNVGVGTTTPDNRLTVEKNIDYSGNIVPLANSLPAQISIKGDTTTNRLILGTYYTPGNTASAIQSSDYYPDTSGDPFKDHGTSLLLNPLGGYVGIGTVTPSATLEVGGTSTLRGTVSIGGVGQTNELRIGDASGDPQVIFAARNYQGSTERSELLIYKGDDGVGDYGPDRIRLKAPEIRIQAALHNIDKYTDAGTDAIIVNSSGNVGIRNTAPSAALDVSGDTKISGGVTANQGFLNTSLNVYGDAAVRSRLKIGGDSVTSNATLDVAGNAVVSGTITASNFIFSVQSV